MNDEYVMTVADIFAEHGFECVLDAPENAFLREIKANTHVGGLADAAIQAGLELNAKLDQHSSVCRRVMLAIVEHIRILYYG